jgi:predicted Zn-dependent protease
MVFPVFARTMRGATPRWPSARWLLLAAFALAYSGTAKADDDAANEAVVERYEQILERSPVEGPSLDKLLQIYQEGEGLEKLDARWTPWSTQTGAKGATYSLLRGLLADRMGKTDEARRLLQAATQLQADDYYAWLALGDFEVRQGQWTDAIAALQKGLATPVTGDDRLSLYRKLGQAQERHLDLTAALATWQKMVGEFPKDSFALEEAGASELDAEQFDEAKKTFQKLVDLTEPNSMNRVQALMHLAEVDDRQGKTETAVHDYESILPLTAESSWLNRELRAQIEQIYRREDDLAGLVTYYQKWTTDNPKDVEALLLLSSTLSELGKKDEALNVLRKVTVLAPDRHEVRQSFAQALVEAKQYDEAITVLTALTADDPTEPRYWETKGEALWLKTQPPTPESKKAVLDAWAHIAPPDSKDVAAVLRVADLCREHNLNDEALADYQRALGLSPDASDIREKEVKLLVDLKRQDEAWKLLDQMIDGSLATAANYLKLATLDQQFERKDAAVAAIQKGLQLEPNNFDLLSQQWGLFAEAQKWDDCIALFDKLIAAAPNIYFIDQLESRHLQALTSAGKLDATGKELRAKLGSDPGLSEGELRLLLRIMFQQADADIPKALDEAHRRFPKSVSLIQIEIDFDRRQGNFDAAVAALQRLIETVPEKKADWLNEIVHVRQDQGNADEALKAAQQIIDASPASADGYLLYAEIALTAGKQDDAVAKLQAAIKLSDKPNDVRQRLARFYLETGQAAKARTVYDDAFTAADNPQDKLTIVRAMTAAYFQDGKIEELINRFKKEQASEEGGWRYGLYLSAIDEQMQDYGAARRELAKSLVIRPNDTGLLHSLIGLADKENDRGELLRYRELLAQADPSVTNEIALANEYASQDKAQDAWRIVQKNLGELAKDPLAWKDVLNQITDPEYSAKIKSALEEAIRSKGDSFEGKFALVQFQMQQGDLAGAKSTLWNILSQPLPAPAPSPPGATTKPATNPVSAYAFYQTPLFQRTSQSYLAINEAQQLLAPAQTRNQVLQRMNMIRAYGNRSGVSTTLDPTAIKDHALIYLSVIAVQEKQADELLTDFQARFAAWHWPLSDQVVAYALIQAREQLLEAMEEQAKSTTPDRDLDEFCFISCEQFLNQRLTTDDGMRKRAEAVQSLLGPRLTQDPQLKSLVVMLQLSRMSADTSPDALAKKKAAVDDYLKSIDRKSPDQLLQAIGLAAQVSNWDEIRKAVDDLAATDSSKWSVMVTQQITYLPAGILQAAATSREGPPKDAVAVLLKLIQLGYPSTPPHTALAGASLNQFPGGGSYTPNVFPPANRYFTANHLMTLQPLFQQLKTRNLTPAMYAALDQEETDLNDWRKIYPILLRIYFQWWDGKKEDSVASVRKLLEQDSSDDFRLLLASMLSQEQKYDEAIPVLEAVTARYGPDYVRTQKELLHVARLAKNNDVGQKAGQRLLALRLPQQEQMQILDDLRNVGLKDKADEIAKRQSGNLPGGNNMAAAQANSQLMSTLNDAIQKKDETQAVSIARQILNRDPMAPMQFGNENYLRTMALTALKNFDQLDSYAAEIEKQLEAAPDSVRLNWLAAEAYQNMDAHVERTIGMAPLPQWLKLQRTGNQIEGFYSLDGTNWIPAGETQIDLPGKVCIGFWVSAERRGAPVQATVEQIALTGKISAADALAPPAPVAATPASSTNAPTGVAPVSTIVMSTNVAASPAPPATTAPIDPLLAPWRESDIGTISQPGSTTRDTDGSLTLTGALGGEPPQGGGTHYVYQMLDGDGSVVARVNHLAGPMDERRETAGIMIRESAGSGSRAVTVALNPTRGVAWHCRQQPSTSGVKVALGQTTFASDEPRESIGWSMRDKGEFTTPIWLKLARKDNSFTGSCSTDGRHWTDLFSRNVSMGPEARVGLISTVNSQQPGQSVWSDVKVTVAQPSGVPAQPTPAPTTTPPADGTTPAPGSLPQPWEFIALGEPTPGGSAQWTGPELTISSSVMVISSESRSCSFVYQPMQGDGEIVAQLKSQQEPGYPRRDGLCLRSRLDKNAPEVEIYRNHTNQIGYYLSTDTGEQALSYYKKVSQLDPKNQAVLITVAEQLRRAKRPGDAADLYASILKTDFNSGMTQFNNVLQAFDEAQRLPELIKIIEDWTSPPLNPMGGMSMDMYFVLVQLGNQLQQNHHLPEAERVYRKALTVQTYQSKQDSVAALVQILIDENRRDEAGVEVEKWILNGGAPAPAKPPPILGFNVQIQSQIGFFQSIGWNQNGIIVVPLIRVLQLADDLGLTAKLQQELKARIDQKGPVPGGQIDSDRITSILLSIMARDPGYRPEAEKMLKDSSGTQMGMGGNTNALMIISQQLEKWPSERPMAMRLSRQIYDGTNAMPGNNFFQNIAALQMIRIARASGDHKATQDLLRKIADSVREQRAVNPNQVQLDQILTIARWMIQEDMLKEASSFLADAKTDPQLAINNSYYQPRFDQAQKDISFAQGEIEPSSLIYGLAPAGQKPKGKGTLFFWQLNTDKAQTYAAYSPPTAWNEAIHDRATTLKIEVRAGPDEEHVTTPVATLENVALHGSAPIRIPPGMQVLQATLVRTKPLPVQPTATSASPSNSPPGPVAAGHLVLLGGPENLLKNPEFNVTRDATGKSVVDGWHGLIPANISQESGGPLPAGGYQAIEVNNGMFGSREITSDRIALQPDTNYVLSGWMSASTTLGIRCLDADGKVLNDDHFDVGGGGDGRWLWYGFTLGEHSGRRNGGSSIPPNTVFVEIFLKSNQDFNVANLSFRVWPTPSTAVPPTAPKPTTGN